MSSITLRHKAHEEIKKKIIFFEIMPGEKLSDKQIAAELGLGRTPVREALLVLEREGLVQCSGKQGYFVRPGNRSVYSVYDQSTLVTVECDGGAVGWGGGGSSSG